MQRRVAEPAVEHRPLKRALVSKGPLGRFEMIAGPIGQTGRRVAPSCTELIWRELKLTTAQHVPKAKLPPWPIAAR